MKNTISTEINRNFYTNLRDLDRSHLEIMKSIQPNRKEQFYKDIKTLINPKHKWWEELIYAFMNRSLRGKYEIKKKKK